MNEDNNIPIEDEIEDDFESGRDWKNVIGILEARIFDLEKEVLDLDDLGSMGYKEALEDIKHELKQIWEFYNG